MRGWDERLRCAKRKEAYVVCALEFAVEHAVVGGGDLKVLVEQGAEEGGGFFFLLLLMCWW
jgi:hypothetical protein